MRDFSDDWTRTTCPYCGVGCGVLARPGADGVTAEIQGDPAHPANFGRLCSKGAALGETLSLEDRLLKPYIGGAEASWDEALDLVADRFTQTIARHGPDSVALYVSGQILTEDYYVANKLMKGFIGSANIDTNSRLCMASSVAGHKRAFGSDTVPGNYEDIELADLVVLVGSNLAWCHPVLYQRLATARERHGTKVVVIDPRRTATCDIADLHLAIAPGSDVALFNGLLLALHQAGALDQTFILAHTSGFDAAFATAIQLTTDDIARLTGLAADDIQSFYDMFVRTAKTVTIYSQGVNQSTAGTDKVNAILNCHLATGRIGRPGCGPFSVTGQPNAMGGREVGGLANMLAAHMELTDPDHRRIVRDFWRAPRVAEKPGLKAIDLFNAIADGRVKAVWIMATNPVDSLPDADAVRAALGSCPFVVVSDVTRHTDTTAMADVLLPAAAWAEKDGTVTNSERRISRQRRFLSPPGDARADWWQISEVAKRMGFGAAFSFDSPAEIFAEYAAMTGAENNGSRDLDISALSNIPETDYEGLEPFQWPRPAGAPAGQSRFFADGGFFTPDRRGRFIATPWRAPASEPSTDYPLVLNTGRIRDQWHTMTRTGKTARLTNHYAEPFIEIHPDDAATKGIAPADLAEVRSPGGRAVLRAVLTREVMPGTVFAPMHWTDQIANAARIGALIAPNADRVSGQPESKYTPVSVTHLTTEWQGFAVCRTRPDLASFAYAALAPASRHGYRVELADDLPLDDPADLARRLFGASTASGPHIMSYHDAAHFQHRFAAFDGDTCAGLVFVGRGQVAVSRTWAAAQLGQRFELAERLRLLAGRSGADTPDKGPIICACFEVGRNDIQRSIANQGCASVAGIGAATQAGTNCGSCRAEIGKLIDEANLAAAS